MQQSAKEAALQSEKLPALSVKNYLFSPSLDQDIYHFLVRLGYAFSP